MSEPEELILEGAHLATRIARDAWRRYGPAPSSPSVTLATVRGRLELFVAALFGRPIPVRALEPRAPMSWLARLAAGRARTRWPPPICATDGTHIFLAPALNELSPEAALCSYRLLAAQQAVRLMRQTHRAAAGLNGAPAKTFYMVAEADAADAWLATHAPGLRRDIDHARAVALATRDAWSFAAYEPAENLVRALLRTPAGTPTPGIPSADSAFDNAAWAQAAADRHPITRAACVCWPADYWGTLLDPPEGSVSRHEPPDGRPSGTSHRRHVSEMRRSPRIRRADEDEDDTRTGAWIIRADDPQESVEDPSGLQRPADRDDHADPGGLADSLSDLPEVRVVRTPEQPREVLRSVHDVPLQDRTVSPAVITAAAIAYPEWDCRRGEYRHPGALVRQPDPAAGDAAWVASAWSTHARLIRRVRTRFERLRRRPARLFRQIDGPEVDVASFINALADRRAGRAVDARMYVDVRPGRRELAVALLVDVSASTDAWVSANRRIVDAEKEAMLVVCEALDALGDPFALFAFSSDGPEHVYVPALKRFDERLSLLVHRRIAALDAHGYTRLGGALRHVTAALCRQRGQSRLLLLLSDGKPNDVDAYEGVYGLGDTRQAVAEARRQGVAVFCLTVDREAPHYAGYLFGRHGFAVLHKPEQLPHVVVDVVRQLARRQP